MFSLPFVLIGLGAAGLLLFLLLWQVLGRDIPATVIGSRLAHTSKNTLHILEYRFQSGEQTISGSAYVSTDLYESYQSPNSTNVPVTIHYFGIGPLAFSRVNEDGSGSLWLIICTLAPVSAIANLLACCFVYQFWLLPRRMRRLYRDGAAAVGTLTGRETVTGKKSICYASYSFMDPFSGKTFKGKIQLGDARDMRMVTDGRPVTVLYLRENPNCSTVYEFGGYRFVEQKEG